MKFTLVSTVFNEAKRIQDTLHDINNQTRLPDEVIITDAGSTDGTVEILNAWALQAPFPVKIFSWSGCTVAQGRNKAIAEAAHLYILSTDFGCRFHPLWIGSMLKPFDDPSVEVVGGTFAVVEADIQTIAAKANYIICDGYYVKPFEGFIPSSRSIAYKRTVWETIGGYAEWLTLAADDLIFGMVLLKQQHKIVYVETPYVYWGRHTTTKAYAKEAFRYGLGDGEAQVNQRQVVSKTMETAMRYMFYLWTLILPVLCMLQGGFAWWMAVPFIGTFLGFRSYYWSFKNWLKYKSDKYTFSTFLYSLILIEESRVQYIKGYIRGYFYSNKDVQHGASVLKSQLR